MPPCGTQNVSGAVSLGSSPITLPLELQIPFHSPSTLSYLELLLHLTSFLYLLRDAVSSSLESFLLVRLANSTSSITTLLSCNCCKASLTISLFHPLLLPWYFHGFSYCSIWCVCTSASPLILIEANVEQLPWIRNYSEHFLILPHLFLTVSLWVELLLLTPPFHRLENWVKPLLQGSMTWQWAPWLDKCNKYWTPTLADGIKMVGRLGSL